MADWFKAFFDMLRFCLRRRRRQVVGVAALLIVCNLAELLWPEVLKLYVDSYGDAPLKAFGIPCQWLASEKGRLLWLPLMLVAAAAIRWATNFWRILVQGQLAQDVLVGLRARIYQRLQQESFAYHDRCHSGSLITNLVEDVRFSTVFFENAFFNFIEAIIFILLAWAMIWRVSPESGMTVVGIMSTAVLAGAFLFRRNLPRFIATRTATADMVRRFNEYVEGKLLIQAYGMNREVSEAWNGLVTNVQNSSLREIWWQILFHQIIMWGALASTFGAVAAYVINGRTHGTPIADGVLVYVISILIIHLQRCRQFCGSSDNVMRFMVTAVRLREFLGPDFDLPEQRPPADRFTFESLEFRNVTFAYPEADPVLHDVSFRIDKPGMLGIAGITGAGKSTIVQLAAGLYQPQSGTILLNGKDLGDWDPAILRHATALVFQDVFLFSGNVRDNIAFGLEHPPAGVVEQAAADAEATEFINELPDGFETAIGEKGVSLSGGQRQRLSLARALARQPAMLVLDSCTSALDTATESKVLDNLRQRADSQLAIVISHRASALARADYVLILEAGRVAAFAPPRELAGSNHPAWRRTLAQDDHPRGLPHA